MRRLRVQPQTDRNCEPEVLGGSERFCQPAEPPVAWSRATVFLEEPLVPLDNNPADRSLRAVVLGRKNFQGSRSERGTRVAALFYSLIASCSVIGVEPAAYLREAVRRAVSGDRLPFLPSDFKANTQH